MVKTSAQKSDGLGSKLFVEFPPENAVMCGIEFADDQYCNFKVVKILVSGSMVKILS